MKLKVILVFCLWSFIFCLLSEILFAEEVQQICFKKNCFTIEIADEPQEWQQGLMFRKFMPEDHGMLFVFEMDRPYSFWMKNTLIPLDMIWLDREMTVVYIEEDVPLCAKDPCPSYQPDTDARCVLELNAGTVQRVGLTVGDVLTFRDDL